MNDLFSNTTVFAITGKGRHARNSKHNHSDIIRLQENSRLYLKYLYDPTTFKFQEQTTPCQTFRPFQVFDLKKTCILSNFIYGINKELSKVKQFNQRHKQVLVHDWITIHCLNQRKGIYVLYIPTAFRWQGSNLRSQT